MFVATDRRVVPVAAQCGPNAIVCENTLTGNPRSEWDIVGAGDNTIQGFATDISVNKGDDIHFKINTPAGVAFTIDIYRLGYYGGLGGRYKGTVNATGITQSACLFISATRLVDCGNWTESASWHVPDTAVSGIYIAKLKRIEPAAQATSSSSCETTRAIPICCFKHPTRRGRPTTNTADPVCIAAVHSARTK
jgi:hypothetical protein